MVDKGKIEKMFRDTLGIKIIQNEKTARDLLHDVMFFLLGHLKVQTFSISKRTNQTPPESTCNTLCSSEGSTVGTMCTPTQDPYLSPLPMKDAQIISSNL